MADQPKLALVDNPPPPPKKVLTPDLEYDELEEGLDDDEGVFEDNESIFEDDEAERIPANRVQHGNPQTTRARELGPEQMPSTPSPAPVVQLVAVFDAQGQAQVARTVNGNRVEPMRAPTAEEWQALKTRGRLVQGGLSAAPDAPASTSIFKSPFMMAAIAAALVGGGYYLYQKYATEDDELDEDAEDV